MNYVKNVIFLALRMIMTSKVYALVHTAKSLHI